MKSNLTIAPKKKSFKQDSIELLHKTQSELNTLKLRVDEARIKPSTNKELETAIALTGLKVIKFEHRLEMFIHHHGQTQDYLDMQNALDDFKLENDELMEEFHKWLKEAKV